MRPKIPYVDFKNWQGLYTKSSTDVLAAEQLRVVENCDFFDVYGAISKMRGNSRVLDAVITENDAVVSIPWIGFYKASDLDGRILRKVLFAAGTKLGELENGTMKVLESNRTAGLYHTYTNLGRFMFISNVNPDATGVGDKLIKYDGAVTTQWGLTPPGSQEFVADTFGDIDYSTFNAVIQNEATDGTGTTWDGDALRVDKFYVDLGPDYWVEREFYPPYGFYPIADLRSSSDSVANRVNFQLFIPRGLLTPSNQFPTGFWKDTVVTVRAGKDQTQMGNDYWEFYYKIGDLVEGWNKLNLDFSSDPNGREAGDFYPENTMVKRMRWHFHPKSAATFPLKKLRLDRLVRLDQGAPVVSSSGAGSFSGVYKYKVTYVSKYGAESNAGPASSSHTAVAASQLDLTKIPVSSDPQIIKRNIYRTVANGSVYLFVNEIPDNTTTVYTDAKTDGNLGNATPPAAGDFSDDNSPPPTAGIVQQWKRTIFLAGDPQNPEELYFSEDNDPESFPLINSFTLDAKITGMYQTYSGLVVETETGKWQVIGDNPDFAVDKIVEGMGCVGRRACGTSKMEGYAVDRDGMRLFNLSDTNKISEPIRDKYDDLNRTNIEFIHTVHSKDRNSLIQFNPDSSGDYTSIFNYQYPIDDVNQGYWGNIILPTGISLNFLDAEEIEDSNGDFLIYAGGDDGMIYQLFDADATDWVDSSGSTEAITTKFTTPYMRLGELGVEADGVRGRIQPQMVEVRTKGAATTWTVTIDMADASDQPTPSESKTISIDFASGTALERRSVPSPGLATRTFVRLTLTNSDSGVDSTVVGVRLYFHSRPEQGPTS